MTESYLKFLIRAKSNGTVAAREKKAAGEHIDTPPYRSSNFSCDARPTGRIADIRCTSNVNFGSSEYQTLTTTAQSLSQYVKPTTPFIDLDLQLGGFRKS
jgi:hypothetical protein